MNYKYIHKKENNPKLLELFYISLKEGNEPPLSVTNWLLESLDKLFDGKVKTLDEAMGLEGRPGSGKSGTQIKKMKRNKLILDLIESLKKDSKNKTEIAGLVVNSLNGFERRESTILKTPEYDRSSAENILIEIFKIDPRVPRSISFIKTLIN